MLRYAILTDLLTFNLRPHIEFGIGRLWRSLKILRPFSSFSSIQLSSSLMGGPEE